jgi:ABC-type multidrug transport system fused ATPase/permease subunit
MLEQFAGSVGSNRLVRRQDRTPLPTGELSYMVILANETISERITGKPSIVQRASVGRQFSVRATLEEARTATCSFKMISFSNINNQYGKQLLFLDASFQLNPGEKVGLVCAGRPIAQAPLIKDAQETPRNPWEH